jgi:sodium transport system ATP-binding protein
VVVDGEETDAPAGRRQRVGALLDHKGLYVRLTARENVAYFGALRGFSGGELARRVQRALAIVGLESEAERRTEGFSQGERMKVALARAIVHTPRNLLLDEPTTAWTSRAHAARPRSGGWKERASSSRATSSTTSGPLR